MRGVVAEANDIDIRAVLGLLEDELVIRDVPVCDALNEWHLKNHHTLASPDLKQVFLAIIQSADFRVDNFDEHGTEKALFVVLATGDDFVQFVERYLVHDFFHILL